MNYWGFSYLLDASGCNHEAIISAGVVKEFAKELVKAIDMKAYGEPQIVNFGEGDKEGFTLVQLIETSNICAHFCNATNEIYLDIFSCKPFDKAVALKIFREFFEPRAWCDNFVVRDAPPI